jgi:hypothetical protein
MTKLLETTHPLYGHRLYVPLDSAFEEMLIGAERYACGRRTYIVSDAVSYITSLLPHLSENTLRVFRNDMADMYGMEERSGNHEIWGDSCDKTEWDKFTSAVIAEIQKREANNAGA